MLDFLVALASILPAITFGIGVTGFITAVALAVGRSHYRQKLPAPRSVWISPRAIKPETPTVAEIKAEIAQAERAEKDRRRAAILAESDPPDSLMDKPDLRLMNIGYAESPQKTLEREIDLALRRIDRELERRRYEAMAKSDETACTCDARRELKRQRKLMQMLYDNLVEQHHANHHSLLNQIENMHQEIRRLVANQEALMRRLSEEKPQSPSQPAVSIVDITAMPKGEFEAMKAWAEIRKKNGGGPVYFDEIGELTPEQVHALLNSLKETEVKE